ncbi:MAG: P-loop NTPase [Betaproteobacteria bacterium]|nr:P-loop NTPase [Betaproteobacteria bacterium]
MNQATSLSESPGATKSGANVLAVTSGKGGVGKTFVSANLAASMAKRGLKVLVLDADLGLANLDVVLNLYPKTTLHDVFTGKAKLEEAILPAPGGFSVLLAGSGMVEYSRLTAEVREQFQRCCAASVPCMTSSYWTRELVFRMWCSTPFRWPMRSWWWQRLSRLR